MVFGIASIETSTSYALAGYAAGKIAIPVSPSNYLYSHFKHVSGIPAPEGTAGIDVSKLKILDVLIDQLAQLKKKPEPHMGPAGKLSDDRIDALIDQYEKEIKGARAASLAMPYKPMPSAPAGVIFNLVA
ncbi:hypothetical protein MASR2M78_06820 [Treponema sp.]